MGIAVALAASSSASGQQRARVAADAAMQSVIPELVAAFEETQGGGVGVDLAAAGYMTERLVGGAPYDLALVAGDRVPDTLVAQEVSGNRGTVVARTRLALYVRRGSPITAGQGLEGLADALEGNRLGRVAMPRPAVSPHGRAARSALRQAGLWQPLVSRLAFAPSASAALRRASGGPAQAALVPLPLTQAGDLARHGSVNEVDPATYEPVTLRAVVLVEDDAHPAAAFAEFLQGDTAQEILSDYAFETPPF